VDAIIDESNKRREAAASRDKRVCICGHPVRAHTGFAGRALCKPTKMECPCRTAEPVLLVQDTREFLWATTGPDEKHALALGIRKSQLKGKKVEWIDGVPSCRICEKSGNEERLVPCPVTAGGQVATWPEKLNGLLCAECIERIAGRLESENLGRVGGGGLLLGSSDREVHDRGQADERIDGRTTGVVRGDRGSSDESDGETT
jgi:hypothetical protein